MASNPINLALRFFLELAALMAMGYWGWQQSDAWPRYLLALLVPLFAATLWGTFRVPNDPGKAPVAVPGIVRLLLELAYFGFAVWALFDTNASTLGWVLAVLTGVHSLVSYDRIIWMLKR